MSYYLGPFLTIYMTLFTNSYAAKVAILTGIALHASSVKELINIRGAFAAHRINVGVNPIKNTPNPSFLYERMIVGHILL